MRAKNVLKFLVMISVSTFVVGMSAPLAVASQTASAGLNEGLLVEADLALGTQVLAGRVLVSAGREQWTTVAMKPATKTAPALKFEVRANLVDSDVAQVEARVTGKEQQSTTIAVRLGDRGTISQEQMEGGSKVAPASDLKVGVKVLRVRYSL